MIFSVYRSYRHNGYIHSAGSIEARKAIATRYTLPKNPLTENDIIIASGCSGALDLAITVLLNPNDILLVPRPAFPLYATLCESKGILIRQYNLLPNKEWEIDLTHLESIINDEININQHRIGAILVNNPSNPCGSVYSQEHLINILHIAEKYKIPIIADEIYGGLVFPSSGKEFYPMANLTTTVPILSCGGIAKEFLVPGWRVGWVCIYDPLSVFQDIRKGLFALSQLILGANSLIISALPAILTPIPDSDDAISLENFHLDTIEQLEDNAKLCVEHIRKIPGLDVIIPSGAMYLMFSINFTQFKDITNDIEFAQKLLSEENVFVLPGTAFNIPGYCRIVFCAPSDKLEDAFTRMNEFCIRHSQPEFLTNTFSSFSLIDKDNSKLSTIEPRTMDDPVNNNRNYNNYQSTTPVDDVKNITPPTMLFPATVQQALNNGNIYEASKELLQNEAREH